MILMNTVLAAYCLFCLLLFLALSHLKRFAKSNVGCSNVERARCLHNGVPGTGLLLTIGFAGCSV